MKTSVVEKIVHGLDWLKYGLAGAIGSLAVVHTAADLLFDPVVVSTRVEYLSIAAGSIALLVAARVTRQI